MKLTIFVMTLALCNVLFVIELVRKRKILENFALLWLSVGIGGLILSFERTILDRLANFLGIQYGAALIFTFAILFLLILSMYLSLYVSKLERKCEILAQEITFLRQPAKLVEKSSITTDENS